MPLYFANSLLGNLQTYRLLHISSRFGSGKTALAFCLANYLKEIGAVRYICSNVYSPWVDKLEDVQLDDYGNVDACLIMDEAGMFMQSKWKAQRYMAYMRKYNVICIMPSAIPPAAIVSFMKVRRIFNGDVFGLPLWVYKMRLIDGDEATKETFYWWNPSEIFGLYDTAGFPSDDAQIEDYLEKWAKESARIRGYALNTLPGRVAAWRDDEPQAARDAQLGLVEELRGVAEALEENTAQSDNVISVLRDKNQKRRY